MLAILAAASLASAARADEFRVENKVFADGDDEPQAASTTIFHDGVAYDYLDEPAEVTVIDPSRGRFVLIDMQRRVRTELTADEVAAMTERVKQWAQRQTDPFLSFQAAPQLDEKYDDATGELTLASPWITYRLTTVDAEDEALCRAYHEFADAYSRLNTALNPGARPPFARLAVNEALQRRQRFATGVELTLRPKDGFLAKKTVIRSEHQLVRHLVQSDRDRVAQTGQFMVMFPHVTITEYLQKQKPAN